MSTTKPSSSDAMSRRLYDSRLRTAKTREGDALDAVLDALDADRANFCADDPGVTYGFDTHIELDTTEQLPSEYRVANSFPRPIHSIVLS